MISKQYIAGFLDGEGTIRIHRIKRKNTKDQYQLEVNFAQNDLRPLIAIRDAYGGYILPDKNCNKLSLSGLQADKLLRDVFEYLIVKKEKAIIALEYRDTALGYGKHEEKIYYFNKLKGVAA